MSQDTKLITFYDSPEISSDEELLSETNLIRGNKLICQVLEGFPDLAVIINKNRQIVAFNKKALKIFNIVDNELVIGKRLGEALSCIHFKDAPAGCGTSKFCAECGAARAIKFTNENSESAVEECRITTTNSDNRESWFVFNVNTQPVNIDDNPFTLFAVKDITGDKKREALESIFFHDVLNTSSAVNAIANLLNSPNTQDEKNELLTALIEASNQLADEVSAQRELRNAEDGNLSPVIEQTTVNEILKAAYSLYYSHSLALNTNFSAEYFENDVALFSDHMLIVRSICNLLKNALEASGKNDKVNIYAERENGNIIFSIYNNKVMPENIQVQIFQHSFSTKSGHGRGVGTYSVKLLVEQYLNGKVFFKSNKESGTIFSISIPLLY